MKQLADDLFVLEGFPPYAINVYLAGTVLIDAATRFDARRILRRLRGRVGDAARLDARASGPPGCEPRGVRRRLEFRSGAARATLRAMETPGEIMARMPRHWLSGSVGRLWTGPPHPVSRRLREGDKVGSFRVIETPGHTAGHVSFWREADRILITGDVLVQREHLERAGDAPRAGGDLHA